MRSVLLSLLMAIAVSSQQDEPSSLCSRLGVVQYKIFPLSSEIKKNFCEAEKHTCSAFEMFSSNDFAKEVVHLKKKIGCYANKETDGIAHNEMCNRLRALPESAGSSLFPLLDVMQATTEEWILPLLEEFC